MCGYMMMPLGLSLDEMEVFKRLYEDVDYKTMICAYTIQQIVVSSDKRLELTTQKVRTIINRFKKLNYIEVVEIGRVGKPTKIKINNIKELTTNQQLSNNYLTTKNEQLQGVEDLTNNYLTTNQQLSNNLNKEKEKEKEKTYSDKNKFGDSNTNKKDKKATYGNVINNYTDNIELVKAINDFMDMRKKKDKSFTVRALELKLKDLDKLTDDDLLKIEILEQSIKNSWKGVFPIKKATTGIDGSKNNSYNGSICNKDKENSYYKKFKGEFL